MLGKNTPNIILSLYLMKLDTVAKFTSETKITRCGKCYLYPNLSNDQMKQVISFNEIDLMIYDLLKFSNKKYHK